MVEALDDASTARAKAIVKAGGLGDATRRDAWNNEASCP